MIKVQENLVESLKFMLVQLKQNKLAVDLVDAPDPKHVMHRIRIKVQENPVWYSELCGRHIEERGDCGHHHSGHHTRIRRKTITRVLGRLIKKGKSCSKYVEELLEIAQEMNNGTRPDYY